MKTRKQWKVHRCTIQRDHGQRPWDEAYQFLLHRMIEKKAREEEQEERNGSCTLCPCLNHTATTDQTIEQQIERLREHVKLTIPSCEKSQRIQGIGEQRR